jgi:hypothetical protein
VSSEFALFVVAVFDVVDPFETVEVLDHLYWAGSFTRPSRFALSWYLVPAAWAGDVEELAGGVPLVVALGVWASDAGPVDVAVHLALVPAVPSLLV